MKLNALAMCLLAASTVGSVAVPAAPGDVLTQGYDAYRTGAQREEKTLNTVNVSPATFGKVGSLPVDGYVHSQPLVVNRLDKGDKRAADVVYVATGNNSVFAFDVTAGRNE